MKVGDRVTHVDFPQLPGTIVGKVKPWASGTPIILVRWDKSKSCSRHITAALRLTS